MGQKVEAILREGQAAGGALDQSHLKMRFQCGDLAGYGRLGGPDLPRHGGEGPRFGDAHKTPECC
jgi:hypothetical protein